MRSEEIDNTNTLRGLISKANRVMGKNSNTKDDSVEFKGNSYCGPNNTFPVFDKYYISVSKAYINRAKFSKNTKEKIIKCINNKAKIIKCYEESFPKYANLLKKEKILYSSDVFKSTRDLVEKSIKNPGMDLDFVDIIV